MPESSLRKVLNNIGDVLEMKNADYGNAFEDDLNEYGITALSIQAGHKLKRIKQLAKSDAHFESIEDSVFDLAGYAILAYKWMKDKKDDYDNV